MCYVYKGQVQSQDIIISQAANEPWFYLAIAGTERILFYELGLDQEKIIWPRQKIID